MQFKKIAAITGSVLMASLALAGPALATSVTTLKDIGKLASVTDSTPNYPLFVIGATAQTADVAGAVGVAVNLAANIKTTSVVTVSGAAESVSGGTKIETAGNKFTPWQTIGNVKNVLTSSDLSILKDGSYTPVSGSAYSYRQYLYLGGEVPTTSCSLTTCNAPHIEYSRPTTENAPRLSFKMPLNLNVTTYKMTFTTPASLSGVTTTTTLQAALVGTSLSIMNKDFVISDATWDATNMRIADLTLLGGGSTTTVETGADKTVTFGGKDYVIHLDSVSAENVGGVTYYSAIGNVNGEAFQLRAGQTKTLSDLTSIGAIKVFAPIVSGQAGFTSMTIGGAKYKIYYSGTVSKGTETITGLTSTLTSSNSSGWSAMTLTYAPNEDKFLSAGGELIEPFASAYSIKFNSFVPAFDDTTSRQTIGYTPSGYNMLLTYKNAVGSEETVYALYINSTTVAAANYIWGYAPISATYSDNSFRDTVFDESKNISSIDGDYFVISYGGFSHVMRFTSFDPTNSLLTFTDEKGQSINVYNTSATAASLIVDGNTYAIGIVNATEKKIKIDLNRNGYIANETTAAPGGALTVLATGADYAYLVPKLMSSGQGGLYFYKGASAYAANVTAYSYPDLGFAGIRWSAAAGVVTVQTKDATGSGWTAETTTLGPNATTTPTKANFTKNYVDYYALCGNTTPTTSACSFSLGFTTDAATRTYPGFILVEEALQGSTAHNWVYFPVNYSDTYVRSLIQTAVSDDANFAPLTVIGTTGQSKGMTTYGTFVEYDTTAGSATLKYPDSFSYANAYVLGPEGKIGTGGATGEVTTDKVLPITTDVVKLDSEITSADKSAYDLVLVGGPCVNTLVAELATAGRFPYTCSGWPGRNFGRVQVISNAFVTGKAALVIAGTRPDDTDLAARTVQQGFPTASDTVKAGASTEVTGTVSSPAYA